jgi:hypothetical protein
MDEVERRLTIMADPECISVQSAPGALLYVETTDGWIHMPIELVDGVWTAVHGASGSAVEARGAQWNLKIDGTTHALGRLDTHLWIGPCDTLTITIKDEAVQASREYLSSLPGPL